MQNLLKIDTGIIGADETDLICVTEAAQNAINQSIKAHGVPEEYFVRIKAVSGGCSGLTYSIEFDFELADTDRLIDTSGIKFGFDAKTLFYALGITIDYIDNEEDGSGFVFRGYRDFNSCACKEN
jgi:iron-sulfur cluster assembly protein